MKIQIVSQHYHPDNFRVNDIARGLASAGHEIRVLTGLPDYSSSVIPPEYKCFRRRRETIEGVFVRRVPTSERRSGVILRALNYGSFALSASIYALITRHTDFDAIFVNQTSPVFQAIPAIIYKWRTKKRLVLYCYDLWPESMKAWGVGENNLVYKLVGMVSGWIYRACDVVAVTSKPFEEYLINICGVNPANIVYLPQYAEDDYADIAGLYEDNGRIDFMFAGNIGSVQDLDCVLKAAASVKTDKPFCVHFVGDGSELECLKLMAETLGLGGRAVFHGRHPPQAMKAFYRMADCFLLTLRGGDFIGRTLPGKAQGYLCAGKPVIAAADGAGAQLVRDADCGEAVPAGDFRALAEKMAEIAESFDAYRQKGQNGRRYYDAHYTKKMFFDSLITLF